MALSIFVIIRINQGDYVKIDAKWGEIRDLTFIVMMFTVMHIVGFLVGLIYQPMDY